ncbi:MAG: HAD hydrolase-like protein [Clostridia bacterium]|nr:HAD hydrolase-like protein [Clostridia bacterium]
MTIIFDYDGTLHDTTYLYASAVQKVYDRLAQEGYAAPKKWTAAELTKFLGVTPAQMWDEFMPNLPKEIKERSSHLVGELMSDNIWSDAKLYDGAEELLCRLKESGCRLVMLSNCYTDYMDAHRRRFRLDRFFSDYFTAEDYGFIPKYKIVPAILTKYPDRSYMLAGDRASDMEAAEKNGIPFVACMYGFAEKGELCRYAAVLDLKSSGAFENIMNAAAEVNHG